MKASRVWSIVLAVALLSVAAGFWFGVRTGAYVGLMLDSAPRAAISLHQLQGIAAGKTANTVIGLESDIDTAFLGQHHLEQSGMYPLLELLWGFPVEVRREYLNRLADYRMEHPSPLRPQVLGGPRSESEEDREIHKWLIEGARDNQKVISQMVERFATKAPQSQ
jgi:hypothetical protein